GEAARGGSGSGAGGTGRQPPPSWGRAPREAGRAGAAGAPASRTAGRRFPILAMISSLSRWVAWPQIECPSATGAVPLTADSPMMEIAVSGPDGVPLATIQPASARVTVGRLHDANDIVLEPDPELLVSRVAHCALH